MGATLDKLRSAFFAWVDEIENDEKHETYREACDEYLASEEYKSFHRRIEEKQTLTGSTKINV